MDISKDSYLFSFALLGTVAAMLVVYCCMKMLYRLERGEISAILCCKHLNDWVPLRVYIQILLAVLLFVYGHMYLFLLNLPVIIWNWKNLSVGYDPDEIVQSVSAHLKICWFHMAILIGWLFIYTYEVLVLSGLKIINRLRLEKIFFALLQLDFAALWRQ